MGESNVSRLSMKEYDATAEVCMRCAERDIADFLDAWAAALPQDDLDGEAACHTLSRLLRMLIREVGLASCAAGPHPHGVTLLHGSLRLTRYAVSLALTLVP